MRGKMMLYIDQYGRRYFAQTVKELREKVLACDPSYGVGRVSKMYQDTKKGTVHIGYVVGSVWCTAFVPWEAPV